MTKIAIIGAGINGLAFALCLRQLGFSAEEISIYEKGHDVRAQGTGIIFWAEVISLLKIIGVDLTQTGIVLPYLRTIFIRETDNPIVVDIRKEKNQEAYGFLREKIFLVLFDKIKNANLSIQTGFECQDVQQNALGCTIHFKNGTTVEADVVVGCDGIFSSVRKQLFPTVEPISLNIKAYRGIYSGTKDDINRLSLPTNTCCVYSGSQYRVVLYPNFNDYDRHLNSYYWCGAYRFDPNDKANTNGVEELISHMPFCPESLKSLFRETKTKQIICSSTLRQLPFSDCVKGRVALLGDAAYAMAPTAGLGFLLGIINALYLSGYLARYNNDVPKALQEYQDCIAHHVKESLTCTTHLTDKFYVENPQTTASEARDIYAQLYQLIAKSANESAEFYNNCECL